MGPLRNALITCLMLTTALYRYGLVKSETAGSEMGGSISGGGSKAGYSNPMIGTEISTTVTAREGEKAELSCPVINVGPYTVSWMFAEHQVVLSVDKQVISRNTRLSVKMDESGAPLTKFTLKIDPVQASDVGSYVCQINTDPVTSVVFGLEVVVPPKIQNTSEEKVVSAFEGNTVRVSCEAYGRPTPVINWRRVDRRVMPNTSISRPKPTEATLLILNVTRDHAGAYLCEAKNGIEPFAVMQVYLRVQFIPSVQPGKEHVGVAAGEEVILACWVHAYPPPSTYWLTSSGAPVQSDKRFQVSSTLLEDRVSKGLMNLKITNVSHSDFGHYMCVAENMYGKDNKSVLLYEMSKDGKESVIIREQPSRTFSSSSGQTRQLRSTLSAALVLTMLSSLSLMGSRRSIFLSSAAFPG